MPKGGFLGEFEHVVLLAVARLETTAYGMAIQREIEARTGRDVGIGSVYSALDRMEKKGFVSSSVGEPTPERWGRAKRFYTLDWPGFVALERTREMYANLWEGLHLDRDAFGP